MITRRLPLLATVWIISLSGTCAAESDLRQAVATAVRWLKAQKTAEFGWGEETPRVIATLAMLGELNNTESRPNIVNAINQPENDSGVSDCSRIEENLISKQLEVELMLELWRPRNEEHNPGRLSLFILAFTALCKDIRNFHGHDILSQLLRHEPEAPFELGLSVLATCAAGGYPKRRMLRKIAEIANDPPQLHLVDVFSVSAMALACVSRNGQSEQPTKNVPIQLPSQTGLQRAVTTLLKNMLEKIANSQEADGSFGNEMSTALGIQALTNPDFPTDGWDRAKANAWLADRLRPDGSFGTVGETSQILLALATAGGLSQLDHQKCLKSLSQSVVVQPLSPTQDPSVIQKDLNNKGVRITYTQWINRNVTEVKELTLRVPENTTFFEVMKAAAEIDAQYQFSATIWPNGHYVHTIGGRREQPIGFHFWLLYRLPFHPDPNNPPPTDYVAPAGVDDIYVQDGDYFLFWYKNI